MQDFRALANFKNLDSYRAWQREGMKRSGFFAFILIVPLFLPFLTLAPVMFEPAAKDARSWVIMMGSAFALYIVTVLGLGLVATLRLNAWKRAHPWSPPSPRAG
jgi:hypothetical protein